MWKSVRLNKYLECGSNLEAYLWINNVILKDNLNLNLCVIFITCYIVIILENQNLTRKGFLVSLSQKSIGEFLVDFQIGNYRVST